MNGLSYKKILLTLLLTGLISSHMGNEDSAIAESRYIDLIHPFDEKTIYWPTGIPFQLEEVHKGMTSKGFWYEANNIRAAEH